jgi:hypothetical protein
MQKPVAIIDHGNDVVDMAQEKHACERCRPTLMQGRPHGMKGVDELFQMIRAWTIGSSGDIAVVMD